MPSIEITGLDKAFKSLDSKVYRAAAYSAINKVTRKGKTTASKAVREKFRIKAADINRKIKVSLSARGASEIAGYLSMGNSGRGIGLLNFGAVWTRGTRRVTRTKNRGLQSQSLKRAGGRQGVTYQILRSGGRQTMSRAFIARHRRGNSGLSAETAQVFLRTDKGVFMKKLIDYASQFGQQGVYDRIHQMVVADFDRLMQHEVNRRT
jgi:hypothetical protein